MRTLRTLPLLAALLLSTVVSADADRNERWDRNVDRAALQVQRRAIGKFEVLLAKYRGTEQERGIRMQMLGAMEGATNLEFRIAHGEASLKKKAVDYSKYHAALKGVIANATLLIQAAPLSEDSNRVYFVRAQAYAELKDTQRATKDYDFITTHYPSTPFAVRSNLALAGFATEAGLHQVAIARLKKVEEFPEDKHYPFALYQLAWSYYNLNEIPSASSYILRHITYYQEKEKNSESGTLAVSERSSLDHSYKDVVLFYFEGFMRNLSDYSLNDALKKFRRIEAGPPLGKMMLEFANLLRSREKSEELDRWQAQIIDEEHERAQSLDVVITNVDYLFMRGNFDSIVTATAGFRKLDEKTHGKMRKFESYQKAQGLILSVAKKLHKMITETKDQKKSVAISRILAGTYDNFIAIVEESDPRLQQIHYNLGETLFSIKEFDSATNEYVWVLKHWSKSAGLKRDEVSLKAIAARYQRLDTEQLLPKDLKPEKLSDSDSVDFDRLGPLVGEWIRWVDAYLDDFGRKPKSFEQFEFEAHRSLYAAGQTRASIKRMLKLVKAMPESVIATGAASLVLDTYVFDQQWQLLLDVSEMFLSMPKLGDTAFKKRVSTLPADASYKLLEAAYQAKDYAQTLTRADKFDKKFTTSTLLPDVLYIASRAADLSEKKDRSMRYLTELLSRYPKSDKRTIALLARASLSEDGTDFDAAAVDYAAYLSASEKEKDKDKGEERAKLTRRLFVVTWLSKNPADLDCAKLAGRNERLSDECDRYRGLMALTRSEASFSSAELMTKATSGEKANRVLWSAAALTFGGTTMPFDKQLLLSQTLATGASDQDPLFLLVLVAAINQQVPETFRAARVSMQKVALKATSAKSLTRRVEMLKSLETTATKLVKLPWVRIKIAVLSEVAQAYEDFSAELVKLKPPAGMAAEELAEFKKGMNEMLVPFQEKGKQIRTQVLELASEFPADPKEVAGFVATRAPASAPEAIDTPMIRDAIGSPDGDLFKQWEAAIKSRSWARAGFFFTQLKEKNDLPEGALPLMRAVALAQSGARAEAVGELEASLSSFSSRAQGVVRRVLRSQYEASTAAKKAEAYSDGTAAAAPEAKK